MDVYFPLLFGLSHPFSIWIFFSLFSELFFSIFFFNFFFYSLVNSFSILFLFDRGHILDFFQIIFHKRKVSSVLKPFFKFFLFIKFEKQTFRQILRITAK